MKKTPTHSDKYCNNCKHWKNKQAELDYVSDYGICVCPAWDFSLSGTRDVMVLDRENVTSKHMGVNRFENTSAVIPVGEVRHSRYCLVTELTFSCTHFLSYKSVKNA